MRQARGETWDYEGRRVEGEGGKVRATVRWLLGFEAHAAITRRGLLGHTHMAKAYDGRQGNRTSRHLARTAPAALCGKHGGAVAPSRYTALRRRAFQPPNDALAFISICIR